MTTAAPAPLQKKGRKFASFQLKAVDAEKRTFEGYASTWDLDEGSDIVEMGAYARTIDNWRASNGRKIIHLIDQHQYSSVFHVVGKLVDAREDETGLWTKWLVVEGEDGDKVLARVKGGFINGLSIGYEVVQAEMDEIISDGERRTVRRLKELKLFEVSLVIWGMNTEALIDTSSVKALLKAERAGDVQLPPEEKTKLIARLKTANVEISTLLEQEEPKPEPAPVISEEQKSALLERIDVLRTRALATRLRDPALRGMSLVKSA